MLKHYPLACVYELDWVYEIFVGAEQFSALEVHFMMNYTLCDFQIGTKYSIH